MRTVYFFATQRYQDYLVYAQNFTLINCKELILHYTWNFINFYDNFYYHFNFVNSDFHVDLLYVHFYTYEIVLNICRYHDFLIAPNFNTFYQTVQVNLQRNFVFYNFVMNVIDHDFDHWIITNNVCLVYSNVFQIHVMHSLIDFLIQISYFVLIWRIPTV